MSGNESDSVPTDHFLHIENLRATLGSNEVLRGINLTLKQGERVSIIGPSGSGKSTLLRCINLLVPIREGSVYFENKLVDVDQQGAAMALRRNIGMVFQQFNLWPHLKVLRNVSLPLERVLKMPRIKAEKDALIMLEKVGLESFADSYPDKLSGGQRQRVAIARALALQPKIMLFDEPTSALDPELVGGVLQVIEQVADEGMTMIVVTHEMRFARRVSNRIVFMDAGAIVEEGTPSEFFDNPTSPRAQTFLRDVLSH